MATLPYLLSLLKMKVECESLDLKSLVKWFLAVLFEVPIEVCFFPSLIRSVNAELLKSEAEKVGARTRPLFKSDMYVLDSDLDVVDNLSSKAINHAFFFGLGML
jgi:hypothetical protein